LAMHRGLLLYVPTLTEMDVHGVGGIMRRDGEASAAVIISLLHARKKCQSQVLLGWSKKLGGRLEKESIELVKAVSECCNKG
jgi:hypothetical protein